MPVNTPLTSENVLSYIIKTNGQEIKEHYGVAYIEVNKGINMIANAKVVIMDGDVSTGKFEVSEAKDFEPGVTIEIQLGYGNKNKKVFEGIIVNHAIRLEAGNGYLELECYDKSIKMTTRRKNNLFVKKKDSVIISEIISDYGLSKEVNSTTEKHEQVFQYDSTDWDFILTRAESNGLVIVNEDAKINVVKPDLTSDPVLELEYGVSIYDFDLNVSSYNQVPKVEANSWDIKNQKPLKVSSKKPNELKHGNLTTSKLAKVMGTTPYELFSTAPLTKGELQSWADGFASRSALAKLQGTISFIGNADVKLNTLLLVNGLGARFNGKGYISGINHKFEAGDWTTTCTLGFSRKYATQTYPDVNSMPAAGLLPSVNGLQVGVVSKLAGDPDGQMRIQIKLPTWDSTKPVWARLASFHASNKHGAFFIPEVGDEVIVGFFDDNPRFPVVLGSLYSSKNKPPFELEEANFTKAIVTREQMKIEFNEEKKIITIETPAGNKVIIDDDQKKITIEDQNKNIIETSDNGVLIDSPKDIKLMAKGNIVMDAKGDVTIKAAGDFAAQGLNVKQKAQMKLAMEGLTTEMKASTQAVVKGAMVMIN